MPLMDFSNVTGASSSSAPSPASSFMDVSFWTGDWALPAVSPAPAPAAVVPRPDFSNVVGASSSTAPSPAGRVPGWVVYAAGGAAVALVGYLLLRRRRRR